jgi:hypothetical protein
MIDKVFRIINDLNSFENQFAAFTVTAIVSLAINLPATEAFAESLLLALLKLLVQAKSIATTTSTVNTDKIFLIFKKSPK